MPDFFMVCPVPIASSAWDIFMKLERKIDFSCSLCYAKKVYRSVPIIPHGLARAE